MIEIIFGVGVGAFIIWVAFYIHYMMTLKKTSEAISEFISRTENNVNGTLVEVQGTFENLRKITSDISAATEEIRHISHAVASLDKGMRGLYYYFKENVGSSAEANIAGLKAGIKTGVVTLVQNLRHRKEDGS